MLRHMSHLRYIWLTMTECKTEAWAEQAANETKGLKNES